MFQNIGKIYHFLFQNRGKFSKQYRGRGLPLTENNLTTLQPHNLIRCFLVSNKVLFALQFAPRCIAFSTSLESNLVLVVLLQEYKRTLYFRSVGVKGL